MLASILLAIFVVSACHTAVTTGKMLPEPTSKREATSKTPWIIKSGTIGDDLLKAQAIIVKDDDVANANCKTKSTDLVYSDKRFLMCSGSILTNRLVLTTVSCMHEALHYRHNIRPPLAVLIAPFSNVTQVIGIVQWIIHPKSTVDPRMNNYAMHNLAIAKLACKISRLNLKPIKLPEQPFLEQCAEESCDIVVITTTTPSSHLMFETKARITEDGRRKRELNTSKIMRSIARYNNKNNRLEEPDKSLKKLSTRSNFGTKGCPRQGSAVMSGKIQSAVIVLSCDDRQPDAIWQYTDLYDNLDWLNQILGRESRHGTLGGCNTCVYNYYFGCDGKDCRLKIPLGLQHLKSTNYSANHNHYGDEAGLRMFSVNATAQARQMEEQRYQEMVYDMYLNRNRSAVTERVDDKVDVTEQPVDGTMSTKRIGNLDNFIVSPRAKDLNDEIMSQVTPQEQVTKKLENTTSNPDPTNRESDQPYALKPSDLETVQEFFKNNKYEDSGVPQSYLLLYNMFLEEQRQKSRNRQN